jgi:hypothetical protein
LGQHIKFDRPDKRREAIHEQGEPIWEVLYLDVVNITASANVVSGLQQKAA